MVPLKRALGERMPGLCPSFNQSLRSRGSVVIVGITIGTTATSQDATCPFLVVVLATTTSQDTAAPFVITVSPAVAKQTSPLALIILIILIIGSR